MSVEPSEVTPAPPSLHAGQLLIDAEAQRARRVLVLVALLSALGAGALQVAPARSTLHWAATAAAAAAALACATLWGAYRRRAMPRRALLGLGVWLCLATLAAIATTGIDSATCVLLCVLVFVFAVGDWALQGDVIYGTAAGGYLVLGALVVADLLPAGTTEPGSSSLSLAWLGVVMIGVEAVLAFTYWLARRMRASVRHVADELDRAFRELTRRDALLAEAQSRLDAAEGARQRGRLSGQQVDHYTVGELIGRGGGGEVYKAWDESLRAHVALKVLHESLRADSESLKRFFREARACSELDCPHIVKVLDTGQLSDGSPYLAMELLEGCDLATYLRELDQLSIGETVEIISHVGRALETAHGAGIIHRDIKPRNVYRTMRDGRAHWKVLDFGVSKKTLDEVTALTGTGTVLGTPGFMAPEQALGREIDHRADVFSLGVIAYRCLTGQPPFVGYDATSAMRAVALSQPVSPTAIVWMPRKVELVLAIALQKDRQHRFASAGELAGALRAAAEGRLPDELRERGEASMARQPWAEPEPASRAAASARAPGSQAFVPRSATTRVAAVKR